MRNIDKYNQGIIADFQMRQHANDLYRGRISVLNNGASIGAQGCVLTGTAYVDPRMAMPNAGPASVMCWVKHNVNGTFHYIISDFDAGATTNSISMYRQTANKWGFWHGNGALLALSAKQSVVGEWTHLCGVRSGSTGSWNLKLYVNGIKDAEVSGATNPTAPASLQIGKPGAYPSGLTMDGCIGDLKLYERALTPNEIMDIIIIERSTYK